jgi:hypothetical protein
MSAKNILLLVVSLCVLALTAAFPGAGRAESIEPALEQEFSDAKASIANAIDMRAEQLAPAFMQRAQELIKTAESARQSQDAVLFSRASRLARTYAELAKIAAGLQTDVDKLAATKEALDKTKSEIEHLKQVP